MFHPLGCSRVNTTVCRIFSCSAFAAYGCYGGQALGAIPQARSLAKCAAARHAPGYSGVPDVRTSDDSSSRSSAPELTGVGRQQFPGGHRGGVTPVPIPNTEVKPSTADGTAGAGLWESRSLPGIYQKPDASFRCVGLFFCAATCHPAGVGGTRHPPAPIPDLEAQTRRQLELPGKRVLRRDRAEAGAGRRRVRVVEVGRVERVVRLEPQLQTHA